MVTRRAQPLVVVSADTPAIVNGKPTAPLYLGVLTGTSTATYGSGHLRTEPNPDKVWDPSGHYVNPDKDDTDTGLPEWAARWSVRDLPNPTATRADGTPQFPGGYYWLGNPSSADGTSSITAGARQWGPDPGTPSAPAWRSMFPFKPSVVSVDHYLPGGVVVNHPKGVNFNSHFLEHMWLDWGRNRPQPFTWVFAAMSTSWPQDNSRHYLLDMGRNPDSVGFPRLAADDTSYARKITDGDDYRSMLAIERNHVLLHTNAGGRNYVRARTNAGLHPRMYIGIFDGTSSYVGVYAPGRRELRKGTVGNGAAYHHRYYVMGRAHDHMDQDHCGHLLVFEIRYWNVALTEEHLNVQYKQLATSYHFDKYRSA